MAIRSTSGISVSVCQTVTGGLPEILVSAAIMSRSRLRPGSRTTADFISARRGSGAPAAWRIVPAPALADGDAIVLYDRIRQQLFAHGLKVRLGLLPVVAGDLDVEYFPLPNRADAFEAEAGQGMFNGLALRVQYAVLQGNGDTGLDHVLRSSMFGRLGVAGGYQYRPDRAWRLVLVHD